MTLNKSPIIVFLSSEYNSGKPNSPHGNASDVSAADTPDKLLTRMSVLPVCLKRSEMHRGSPYAVCTNPTQHRSVEESCF